MLDVGVIAGRGDGKFMLTHRACYWEEMIAKEVGWGRWERRDCEIDRFRRNVNTVFLVNANLWKFVAFHSWKSFIDG